MNAVLTNVRAQRVATSPLNLVLTGREDVKDAANTEWAFVNASADLPVEIGVAELIEAPAVAGECHTWILKTPSGQFPIQARGAFMHREMTAAMARVIPPQRAPLLRRIIWAALPTIVASSLGRRLLAAIRPQ